MAKIFLLNLPAYDDVNAVALTLRYASGVGYTTRPSDTPANTIYEPRLDGAMFRYDPSIDAVKIGTGEVTLQNGDRRLDGIAEYIYDGQVATLMYGDEFAAYSTFVEVARWTVEQIESNDPTLTVRTRTPLYGLDRSMQTHTYGGTGGLDGGSELAGKQKPLGWGQVLNARAILVDAPKLIYQLSSSHDLGPLGFSLVGVVQDATNITIYDSGGVLTQGADYASVASMNSTAPSVGQFRVCNASVSGATNNYGVYVRLGGTPTGEVTHDCISYPAMFNVLTLNTLSLIIYIASGSTSDIYTADNTAVATVFPYDVSMYFGSDGTPATYLDALNALLKGARGWMVPYQGVPSQYPVLGLAPPWAVRWLDTPASAAVNPYLSFLLQSNPSATLIRPYLTISGDTIELGTFKKVAQYDFGWPEWQTTIQYDRLSYVQSTGLAGAVTQARRARLLLEYLSAASSAPSVLTHFPTAVDRVIATAWCSAVGTIANEATRQGAVFAVYHPTYVANVRADFLNAVLTVPGDPMTIAQYPRFGCDVARKFMILGLQLDYLSHDGSSGTVDTQLTLWG